MEMTIKRFRLYEEAGVALANAIILAKAHIAKTGEVKEKFKGAYNMFCASKAITSKLESRMPKSKLSIIQEHSENF